MFISITIYTQEFYYRVSTRSLMIRTPIQDLYFRSSQLCLIKRIGAAYARARAHTCPCA